MECNDPNCPVHGTLSVRGGRLMGRVVSNKAKRSAVIERDDVIYIPKYKRWAKKRSRLQVHKPDCIEVNIGDLVRVGETRKISKTKSWVILEVIKKGGNQ